MKKPPIVYPRNSSGDYHPVVSAAERIAYRVQAEVVEALKAAEDRAYSAGYKAGLQAALDSSPEDISKLLEWFE